MIDWHSVFVPTTNLLEIIFRGSVIYLFLFGLLRFFRREAGSLSAADLLVLVLVADAAQNAMAAQYTSVTEGAILIATIFAWNGLLDWLAFRFTWAHRVLHGTPLRLIEHGVVLGRNLRRELMTRGDLMEQLRAQGIEDVVEVKRAFLEPDGHLSVIRYGKDETPPAPRRRPAT